MVVVTVVVTLLVEVGVGRGVHETGFFGTEITFGDSNEPGSGPSNLQDLIRPEYHVHVLRQTQMNS